MEKPDNKYWEHEHFVEDEDLEEGQCICGEFNCPDEYAHWTSGW